MSDFLFGITGIATLSLLGLPCWMKVRSNKDDDKVEGKKNTDDVESSGQPSRNDRNWIDHNAHSDSTDSDMLIVREVLMRKQQSEVVKLEQMKSDVASGIHDGEGLDASFESVQSCSAILNDLEELQNMKHAAKSVDQNQNSNFNLYSTEWVQRRAQELGLDLDWNNEIQSTAKFEKKSAQDFQVMTNNIDLERQDEPVRNELVLHGNNERNSLFRQCVDELVYYSSLLPPRSQDEKLADMLIIYTLSPLVEGICELLTICIIAHRLGSDSVIAYGLIIAIIELNNNIVQGLPKAVSVQATRAISMMKPSIAAQYTQLAMITLLLYNTSTYIIWCIVMYDFLLFIGVQSDSAKMAENLIQILFFSGIINSISLPIKSLIEADGYSSFVVSLNKVCYFWKSVAIFLSLVLFDENLNTVGWSCVVVDFIILLVILFNSYWTGSYFLSTYCYDIFATCSINNIEVLNTIFKAWRPLLAGDLLDVKTTNLFTLFTPFIGYYETVSWIILVYIWEFTLRLADAIGETVAARIDELLSIPNERKARSICDVGIVFGVALGFVLMIFILLTSNVIDNMLSSDRRVQLMITKYVPVVGEILIPFIMTRVCKSILYAQLRINTANFVLRGSTWFISIPLCVSAVFKFDFGLNGIIGAIASSSLISAYILWSHIMEADWVQISESVYRRNKVTGQVSSNAANGVILHQDDFVNEATSNCEQSALHDILESSSIGSESTASFTNVRTIVEADKYINVTGKSSLQNLETPPRTASYIKSTAVCLPVIHEQQEKIDESIYPVVTEQDLVGHQVNSNNSSDEEEQDCPPKIITNDNVIIQNNLNENGSNSYSQKSDNNEQFDDRSRIRAKGYNLDGLVEIRRTKSRNEDTSLQAAPTENKLTHDTALISHEAESNDFSQAETKRKISLQETLESSELRSWWNSKTGNTQYAVDTISLSTLSPVKGLHENTRPSLSFSSMRANLSQIQQGDQDFKGSGAQVSKSLSDSYDDIPDDERQEDTAFSLKETKIDTFGSEKNPSNESLGLIDPSINIDHYRGAILSAPSGKWLDIHSEKLNKSDQSISDQSQPNTQWIVMPMVDNPKVSSQENETESANEYLSNKNRANFTGQSSLSNNQSTKGTEKSIYLRNESDMNIEEEHVSMIGVDNLDEKKSVKSDSWLPRGDNNLSLKAGKGVFNSNGIQYITHEDSNDESKQNDWLSFDDKSNNLKNLRQHDIQKSSNNTVFNHAVKFDEYEDLADIPINPQSGTKHPNGLLSWNDSAATVVSTSDLSKNWLPSDVKAVPYQQAKSMPADDWLNITSSRSDLSSQRDQQDDGTISMRGSRPTDMEEQALPNEDTTLHSTNNQSKDAVTNGSSKDEETDGPNADKSLGEDEEEEGNATISVTRATSIDVLQPTVTENLSLDPQDVSTDYIVRSEIDSDASLGTTKVIKENVDADNDSPNLPISAKDNERESVAFISDLSKSTP